METRGDEGGGGAFVERAMEGREEVVDVAVEGCDAEGVGAVFEEEGVDEGTVLWWALVGGNESVDVVGTHHVDNRSQP